jgi:pimeloyl-ACP methyl ester carboxylesterase
MTDDVTTRFAEVNGLRLAYEEIGEPTAPPVVLIMGFGAQLTLWPDEFCRLLVAAGYRVIRFDNRDVGLSDKLDGARVGGATAVRMVRHWFGLASRVPYTLVDMAADVAGLLDHLGLTSAHIVGASMGGMIAQVFAGRYPERVRSVGIIFSSTNQRFLPPPRPAALLSLLASPGPNPTREHIVDLVVKSARIIGSPAYPEPEDVIRARAAADYDRCYYPAGVVRQFAAVTGTGDLVRYSRRITAPTVVIHGTADPLIRPACGRAVARAIPGATLHLIAGMGHDLPPQLHRPITDHLLAGMEKT